MAIFKGIVRKFSSINPIKSAKKKNRSDSDEGFNSQSNSVVSTISSSRLSGRQGMLQENVEKLRDREAKAEESIMKKKLSPAIGISRYESFDERRLSSEPHGMGFGGDEGEGLFFLGGGMRRFSGGDRDNADDNSSIGEEKNNTAFARRELAQSPGPRRKFYSAEEKMVDLTTPFHTFGPDLGLQTEEVGEVSHDSTDSNSSYASSCLTEEDEDGISVVAEENEKKSYKAAHKSAEDAKSSEARSVNSARPFKAKRPIDPTDAPTYGKEESRSHRAQDLQRSIALSTHKDDAVWESMHVLNKEPSLKNGRSLKTSKRPDGRDGQSSKNSHGKKRSKQNSPPGSLSSLQRRIMRVRESRNAYTYATRRNLRRTSTLERVSLIRNQQKRKTSTQGLGFRYHQTEPTFVHYIKKKPVLRQEPIRFPNKHRRGDDDETRTMNTWVNNQITRAGLKKEGKNRIRTTNTRDLTPKFRGEDKSFDGTFVLEDYHFGMNPDALHLKSSAFLHQSQHQAQHKSQQKPKSLKSKKSTDNDSLTARRRDALKREKFEAAHQLLLENGEEEKSTVNGSMFKNIVLARSDVTVSEKAVLKYKGAERHFLNASFRSEKSRSVSPSAARRARVPASTRGGASSTSKAGNPKQRRYSDDASTHGAYLINNGPEEEEKASEINVIVPRQKSTSNRGRDEKMTTATRYEVASFTSTIQPRRAHGPAPSVVTTTKEKTKLAEKRTFMPSEAQLDNSGANLFLRKLTVTKVEKK